MHMKGGSAYELNHDDALHLKVLWQDGYWAESISPSDLQPIIEYVRHQRDHHDASHPAEY